MGICYRNANQKCEHRHIPEARLSLMGAVACQPLRASSNLRCVRLPSVLGRETNSNERAALACTIHCCLFHVFERLISFMSVLVGFSTVIAGVSCPMYPVTAQYLSQLD